MAANHITMITLAVALAFSASSSHAQTGEPLSWQEQLDLAAIFELFAHKTPSQKREAETLYRSAAESGKSEALHRAGCYLYRRGVAASQDEARAMIEKAANLNDPYAKYSLAQFLVFGIGGSADHRKAADLIAQSREQLVSADRSVQTEPLIKPTIKTIAELTEIIRISPRRLHLMLIADCGPDITAWARQRNIPIDDIPLMRSKPSIQE